VLDALFPVSTADVALTKDEWYTPRWLFDAAGLMFDMDVCAPVAPEFRTCPARRYLTAADDGLAASWQGLVWCNPPYSNITPWVHRWRNWPAGMMLLPAANSSWRGPLMEGADALTLISISTRQGPAAGARGFGQPDGSQVSYPTAMILAARGDLATSALAPVASADAFTGGAWFMRSVASLLPLLDSQPGDARLPRGTEPAGGEPSQTWG
jgi:phage N-6-adenine-methyltransferase